MVKAKKDLVDSEGKKRIAGQRWLVRKQGVYQPHIHEEVLETRKAYVLTDKKCIQLRALKNMVDVYTIQRQAGDEWLVGVKNAASHVLDVNEEFVKEVNITSLNSRQYCYIVDPIVNGQRLFGQKILKKGETTFFLQPGEQLENNRIYDMIVLKEDESLLLKALNTFEDDDGKMYEPGSIWMKKGPCDYIPKI